MWKIVLRIFAIAFAIVVVTISSEKTDCTDLARGEETFIVFSTLGGGLWAVHPVTGEIRWNIDDEPAVKTETNQNCPLPQYLPDPRDGSIYQLSNQGDLKKLPFTIPQLVANAPCRSSDGILYSGKKSDMWFLVDPRTGTREKVMGFGQVNENMKSQGTGALWTDSRSIYLGRTQYTVMMYDSLSKSKDAKPWNITFYDYASHTMAPEISSEYEYLHLTGNPSGKVVTLERKGGKYQWEVNLTSPIVAAFLLGPEGLLSVPFTTISDDALSDLLSEENSFGVVSDMELYNYLYVGEISNSLYALPSLSGKNTPTITSRKSHLIDGPESENQRHDIPRIKYPPNPEGIYLGHYEYPSGLVQIDISQKQPASTNQLSTIQHFWNGNAKETDNIPLTLTSDSRANSTFINKTKLRQFINNTKGWFFDHPSWATNQLLVLVLIAFVVMFWYVMTTVRDLKSQSSSQLRNRSFGTSSANSVNFTNYNDPIDLGEGEVRVGKIQFNSQKVLGKGCEGTFVFKGTFEERKVAVKRLLPECFTIADREVSLLRESDAHENVVRYFCTEQDRQFRYIAVELCGATLQDYTEGDSAGSLRDQISVWNVLTQATSGLSHLHSLNIVHRDIKPQNVLISLPDNKGRLKVMISDFGLCKKLNYGKASFSRRSGITGTEGWIAPEMIRGQRTTTSVDIFSLGCVFYYVLSKGKHPFGDNLKRQANILASDAYLEDILENDDHIESKMILSFELISDMIHKDPQRRPPAKAITGHPVFWDENRIMSFLQDVSDRVEKLQFENDPLRTLEKNGRFVVKEDWNLHVDKIISEDIRKYRGYMGASVRDLLRAFRNKKHHYHELPEEAQQILGHIPEEFTLYWVKKFPHLISHTFHAMSICSHENAFKSYYNKNYHFTMPEYFEDGSGDQLPLFEDPKPLQKQSKSPTKKATRKGLYNFRKDNTNQQGAIQNNNSNNNSDVFANFKFRNRTAQKNRYVKEQQQTNIPWILNTDTKEVKAE